MQFFAFNVENFTQLTEFMQLTSIFFRSTSVLGDTGRSGTEGIRNRFSRTFSLYDDPDTRSQVGRTLLNWKNFLALQSALYLTTPGDIHPNSNHGHMGLHPSVTSYENQQKIADVQRKKCTVQIRKKLSKLLKREKSFDILPFQKFQMF